MINRGRGSTGTGRRALLPSAGYEPNEIEIVEAGSVVRFEGEDGRALLVSVDDFTLPGWRPAVVATLRTALGPTGGIRTASSAKAFVRSIREAMQAVANLANPPIEPRALTVAHLQSMFEQRRSTGMREVYAWRGIARFGQFLSVAPLRDQVSQEAIDYTCRPVGSLNPVGKAGYSDGEFARVLVAARTDVAAIRDRIRSAEALISARDPSTSLASDTSGGEHSATLSVMAQTGAVPRLNVQATAFHLARRELASELFLTLPDLAPLLVLLVALTGRNIETIKELPHEHRVLESRAVEVRVIKRRRRSGGWFDTATWEIGPPGRELYYPGGLYLLLHELTSRSRGFSKSASIWSIWRNGHTTGARGIEEHFDPFARALTATSVRFVKWRDRHRLVTDAVDGAEAVPLELNGNRIKTSADVRRTKQLGGHLPSAARTNTVPVLFRNYLSGDPTTREWAHQVITTAVSDAEASALDAHRRALDAAGGSLQVRPGRPMIDGSDSDPNSTNTPTETAWSGCLDERAHPVTGRACRASFLDCFHCGNCVITPDHLPRLLGLLDELAVRRGQLSDTDWWTRYGPAWAAIRHDVLTKFSRSEINAAASCKPVDTLLDLVESPWERP
jgi:hypothetical protein